MNIVYGGAFNPPQLAHYKIVNVLLKKFKNARVIILPVGNNYNKPEIIDFKHRFKMLKMMFENNKQVIISDLENTNEFKGTIFALEELSKTYNDVYLVMGSDHTKTLNTWIRYEELLSNYPLIIMQRNNDDIKENMQQYNHLNVKYSIINFNSEINSTLIRSNPNQYNKWLDLKVLDYIRANKLYGVDQNV